MNSGSSQSLFLGQKAQLEVLIVIAKIFLTAKITIKMIMIMKDYKKKTCLLIDMTVPANRDLSLKEYEKISIQRPRNRNTEDVAFESNSNTSCSWGIGYNKEEN